MVLKKKKGGVRLVTSSSHPASPHVTEKWSTIEKLEHKQTKKRVKILENRLEGKHYFCV